MGLTKTTTGSLSQDAVDFFIKAALEEHGQVDYIFRNILRGDTIPSGNGRNIKFARIPRIVLAGELTEGVPPTADELDAEFVTATATQFGQIVEVSDVVDLTLKHPFIQRGMRELAESAARKDDQLMQTTLGGAANVFYGGGKASRVALTATDVVDTALFRDVIMQLEVGTDGVDGSAPRFPDGSYEGAIYTRHIQDLLGDSDFKETAYRQNREALERGVISIWNDVKFRKNRFGPQFTLEALGAAAGATDASGTLTSATTYRWGMTRTHRKRGFEEGIDDNNLDAPGGTDDSIDFTAPADTAYTYSLYFTDTDSADSGTRRLVSAGLVAASVTRVLAVTASSAVAIPQAPAASITVYQSYVLGREAASVIDLASLQTFMVRGSEKSDVLDQKVSMGTKWFDTSAILNDGFLVLIEAPSNH